MSWALDHAVYLQRRFLGAIARRDWAETERVGKLAAVAHGSLDSVDSSTYSAWASEGPVPVVDVTGRRR